jgi:hypothetical protein
MHVLRNEDILALIALSERNATEMVASRPNREMINLVAYPSPVSADASHHYIFQCPSELRVRWYSSVLRT